MASKNGFASMRIDREVSQTRSTKFSSSAMQIMKNSFHLQVETRIQEHIDQRYGARDFCRQADPRREERQMGEDMRSIHCCFQYFRLTV
jgi:hypothetical protein